VNLTFLFAILFLEGTDKNVKNESKRRQQRKKKPSQACDSNPVRLAPLIKRGVKNIALSALRHRVSHANFNDFKRLDSFVIHIDFGLCRFIDFMKQRT